MDSVLIVSDSDAKMFTELLSSVSVRDITALKTGREVRQLILEKDFDLIIIDAPLADESGESLSKHIAAKSLSQVILAIKSQNYKKTAEACEEDGILAVSKPLNKEMFHAAFLLAKAAQNRLKRAAAENAQLKQKIEDIRVINRAKFILITYMNMSEKEAHRYIEKQAMDMRSTKRVIAEGILRTYEN